MLLSLRPLTVILAAVRPREDAMTILHISDVLALVYTSVIPSERTGSVHLVLAPLSVEDARVGPLIPSFAVNIVRQELAVEAAPVRPAELALPFLPAVCV